MTGPTKYTVSLEELVDEVRVPPDQQVEEQAVTGPPEPDESSGSLPGDVRPYAV